MIICGIDVDALAADDEGFALSDSGLTLIVDGDGPAYRAAATVKTTPTGLRKFQSDMLTQIFLAGCSTAEVFLTHEECTKAGRYNMLGVKPYQGQRSSGNKPPLLADVREAAYVEGAMPEFNVHMERVVEADDAMMMLAYRLADRGVIRSDDKDLRMTPYPYYEIATGKVMPSDPFGELWIAHTESGSAKLLGRSLKFFWAQMMMGDSADNVKGLLKFNGKNIGLQGTFDALNPITNIHDLSNFVIDQYRLIDQNPLPEAWCLWMLRHPHDNVWVYLNELTWTDANRAFLADCVGRTWFKT